jgi:hypothetical protein
MPIDIEEMKRGVESFKKILEQAEKVRSWAITNGENEHDDGGIFSESLYRLEPILEIFEQNNWDIQKVFTQAATDGADEGYILLTNGWETKVSDAMYSLNNE